MVNKYAMPPKYESRLRTIKFAHYLLQMGYEVTIFGSSVMHNMDLDLIENGEKYIERQYDDLHFVHVKSRMYKKTAGVDRILSDIGFHFNLVKVAKNFEKPDLVVATTTAILFNPVLEYCKKNKIKYVSETLDWRPDDYVDFGLLSPRNPILRYLFWRYRKNYAESDACVFSPPGCYDYLKDKHWDKAQGGPIDLKRVFYINNGVDLQDFYKWKEKYILEDDSVNSSKKRIVYLGSIRLANNVMQLIKAAEILKERDDAEFLIYGNGADREMLIAYCKEHNLTNVKFKDKWIDPKFVPFVVSQSYINILNYKKVFGKYGVSSSKMFQYMAGGKPIVCNIDILYSPIVEYSIGVCHDMKDDQDYANAISSILDLSEEEYAAMCNRAKEAAKEYDYAYLAKKMQQVIENIDNN